MQKYSEKDIEKNAHVYTYYHTEDGAVDGWDDPDKFGNFASLLLISQIAHFPLKNATILDVGCGSGDFAPFLHKHESKSYTGIDIFEPSIKLAQKNNPRDTFLQGDFLATSFEKSFDFVFCSGGMTTRLASDNHEMMKAMLTKMYSLANHGVAFNFLVDQGKPLQEDEKHLYFYNFERVQKICREIAPTDKIESEIARAGVEREYLQAHVYIGKI